MDRFGKLALYLSACENTPFEWGKHDCCTFAAGAVHVQIGRNPMEDLPLYASESEATAMIAANGGLESMVTQRFGEPVAKSLARRGDVVIFESGNGPTLGVCIGPKFAAVTANGLMYYSMRHVDLAWRVA